MGWFRFWLLVVLLGESIGRIGEAAGGLGGERDRNDPTSRRPASRVDWASQRETCLFPAIAAAMLFSAISTLAPGTENPR